MGENATVHVIGTGTIGEPLIGLLCAFREQLGIDQVPFHKRTPLLTDRCKVNRSQGCISILGDQLEVIKKVHSGCKSTFNEQEQPLP